jgi:hypothetical protein
MRYKLALFSGVAVLAGCVNGLSDGSRWWQPFLSTCLVKLSFAYGMFDKVQLDANDWPVEKQGSCMRRVVRLMTDADPFGGVVRQCRERERRVMVARALGSPLWSISARWVAVAHPLLTS